jgi:hypothetical protein
MKIYQAVQSGGPTDRHTGDVISLLSFFEIRLKTVNPSLDVGLHRLMGAEEGKS